MARMCLSRHRNINQMGNYVERDRIPSKELLNSGLFASHYFDINPELEPITELLTVKPFSSKFTNPITGKEDQILVLGVTGSEDGQNQRRKTDFVIVIDRSGSMRYNLNDIIIPGQTGTPKSEKQNCTKMKFAIEAVKMIFDIVEEDEEIGFLMFDEIVDIIEDIQPKSCVSREKLFSKLEEIEPRGGTNFGVGLSKAIEMFENCSNKDRNQRIIFLTDACPTTGASTERIRDLAETGFVESKGHLGVTYWGIGLSFDAGVCSELSRTHGTSVSSLSTKIELEETLRTEFNYQVSPNGFDVQIGLRSEDYEIEEVYGGDSDCQRSDSLLEFRTLTASAVGVEGVKGSVLIIHLNRLNPNVVSRCSVEIWIEWTPFGSIERQYQSYEYFVNDEPLKVTEKAYALSVYYQTLQKVLPDKNVRKHEFTAEETVMLTKLQSFLKSQRNEIMIRLENEMKIVDNLIAKHCRNERAT
jgi:hypothetical protein